MNLNYVQIGNRIREARIAAKLSQATLAELADTSPQYISHIENGRKKASLSSLVSIASALDISIDILLTGNAVSQTHIYAGEIQKLLDGLSIYEKRIVLDVIVATKRTLSEHRWMLDV